MRLARVISTHVQRNPALDRLVETAGLDVLQLDYVWPHPTPDGPKYAVGLLHQLQTLHKTLFLDPHLHLITDAGAGDPRACVEAVAEYLCEHGDAKLPLTAIRGANVLPCLEELMAEGVELRDIATGMTLQELTQPIVAAQVELGAGPLATAWNEGSRFVVAGCYDLAAPMIATAVSALRWSWDQVDKLAELAVAAHLPETVVEINQNSRLTVRAQASTEIDTYQLRWRLLETADDEGWFRHADVGCQIRKFELQEQSPDAYTITDVNGFAASGDWMLRIAYQDGYAAEALFQYDDTEINDNTAGMLRACLVPAEVEGRTVQFDLLSSKENRGSAIIRVRCQSQEREPCEAFVREIINVAVQSRIPGYELAGTLPSCQPQIASWNCPVPREAIAVSVDTRPAKEWR